MAGYKQGLSEGVVDTETRLRVGFFSAPQAKTNDMYHKGTQPLEVIAPAVCQEQLCNEAQKLGFILGVYAKTNDVSQRNTAVRSHCTGSMSRTTL